MALPKILTLDLATRTGWCCGAPDQAPRYGTKVLPSTGEDIGRFAYAYNEWLLDMITLEDPALVVFEAPVLTGKTSLTTARKLYGLAWHTEFACSMRQVRCAEHHLQSVKKFFAGSGNATKDDMIAAARRLGFDPKDDNAADAIGLWCCTVHERAPQHAARFKLGALGAVRAA